jgi:hypothetical protein
MKMVEIIHWLPSARIVIFIPILVPIDGKNDSTHDGQNAHNRHSNQASAGTGFMFSDLICVFHKILVFHKVRLT